MVRAWLRLQPERTDVRALNLLKGNWPVIGSPPRRMVCWLSLASGQRVVAKLCKHEKALIEQSVYLQVLPRMERFGNRALRFIGRVTEIKGTLDWIFIEYAEGTPFSHDLDQHRRLLSQWLAALHATTAEETIIAAQVPDGGSRRYLNHLQRIQQSITDGFDNPALDAEHWAILDRVRLRCSALEAEWYRIETFCAGFPQTLVHGDLVDKNMCIAQDSVTNPLLVFDWSTAGWGVPAADLASVDVPTYHAATKKMWHNQDLATVTKLAALGQVFRYIAAIYWELARLRFPWVDKPIANLNSCFSSLENARTGFFEL